MNPQFQEPRGLVLVGYRGTGKSTVGRLLAERLGQPFVDADAALERALGRSIRSHFSQFGEPDFRDREAETLDALAAVPGRVLATGGGVILREANRDILKRYGVVAWLTAESSTLAERLGRNPTAVAARPALTTAGTLGEIDELLRIRTPLYRAVADLECPTDGRSPVQVAESLLAALRSHGFES
jgi:shikimate kinase